MAQLPSYSIPRVVISALRGSSGKTLISLSLIASWRKKGLRVTPFKKGPDYIDAGWLAKAASGHCFNLDLFIMSRQEILRSFIFHTEKARVAVIEGNRGLYDGIDSKGTYSTAELSKLLNAPVILVVDCSKATNTVSAMVLGCLRLDPEVNIRGVVLNNVANKRQESLIRESIIKNCNLPVLGVFPELKKNLFPERHMGLTPFQEHQDTEKSLADVEEIGAKYLDIDSIRKVANEAGPIKKSSEKKSKKNSSLHHSITPSLKIGIVKDSAFQFYYPENLEELEKKGAKLIEVSPLRENKLPDLDALYIGGGFPETHAIALAENVKFKKSLCEAIENGLPVYAECGGLMYLGKSLTLGGKTYPMAGVLPIVFGLEKKPQAHGYTVIEVAKKNPYFPKGYILRGHEFHYSKVIEISKISSYFQNVKDNNPPSPPFSKGVMGGFEGNIYFAFRMKRGHGIKNGKDGLCYKNVLATYTHLHALGSKEWVNGLIKCAVKFQSHKCDMSYTISLHTSL